MDSSGVIRRVNRIGYSLLGQASSTLLGCSIYDALPNLNRTMLEDALLRGKEAYSFLLDINHKGVVVNIAPILVDSQIEGAVLTFQEGQRLIDMDSEMRRELYQRGFVARYNFDNIICDDPETQALFELAKRISKFSAPILLTGETGSGKNLLAQCIHNESLLRKNAFVTIDCSAWLPETLDNMLFGNYTVRKDSSVDSYAEMAQDGTLYLSHVEMLPLETQYKLLCLIRGRFLHNGPSARWQPTSASSLPARSASLRGSKRANSEATCTMPSASSASKCCPCAATGEISWAGPPSIWTSGRRSTSAMST